MGWLKERISKCPREAVAEVVKPRNTLSPRKNGTSSRPPHQSGHRSTLDGSQATRPWVPSSPKTILWEESLRSLLPTSKTNVHAPKRVKMQIEEVKSSSC